MKFQNPLTFIVFAFLSTTSQAVNLVDPNAGEETTNLYQNLLGITAEHVLFGHQNTLAYGYHWRDGSGQSDVKAVTGSYPALYGWDLQDLLKAHGDDAAYNLNGEKLRQWVREARARGGVSTFSWHQTNPATGGSFYDKTPAMAALLPGGEHHAEYRRSLDTIAAFFKDLAPIPVIFRPFHEHNGDWFWWGKPFVSEEDYIAVWRFTVEYLRDQKGVHNLLYAFSPDRSRMDLEDFEASYLYAYPGDNYIDILGLDNYWDVGHAGNKRSAEERAVDFRRSLEEVVALAQKRGKLAALTETGMDTLPDPEWWTGVLLAGLDANQTTRKIAYLQVWRNANRETEKRDHFYAPYPGHPSAEDFRSFKESSLILFEDELPDLYAKPETMDTKTSPENTVTINQVGYLGTGSKLAMVEGKAATGFALLCSRSGKTVFSGKLSPPATWPPSGTQAQVADFTEFTTPGRYVLCVGDARSDEVVISDRPYAAITLDALRYFYLNRCSTALEADHAGPWHRPLGHPDEEVIVHPSAADENRPAGTRISAPRGWYDAGDYNKYIVNSGITTYTLLLLYALAPEHFGELDLNIPESGGPLPDLLAEIQWNLDWMLAMQDPHDGGVYHKLTHLNFQGMVMPHEVLADRYVIQKTVTAAHDFAAVMALAGRIYRPFDPARAERMVAAAEKAYAWGLAHPEALITSNPEGVLTGVYGDDEVMDEKRWAAVELFITTGNRKYAAVANEAVQSEASVPGWPEVNTLGLYSLACFAQDPKASRRILDGADLLLRRWSESAYRVPMLETDFRWGSNSEVANQGMLLLIAYHLSAKPDYVAAAISCLDYLLGRNPLKTSFVTAYGARTPMHPHHRISEADGIREPLPGMLVGGPNPDQQDNCEGYPSDLPALSYVDATCSYASNEVAINWNSPLAFLAGMLDALSVRNPPDPVAEPVVE